ncbi:aminotransferase class I/II-fold pyridoxal phosphate-dependent enzyme [Streptomyces sp. NPDC050448]|uniref:aminotransferase class I/II-fold pyridoxal phosphate-dependent enzyme n=1 Tax=Streptomyces sp. NPDC050448 TaxID=3155404 RepID=UPI00341E957F
MPYGRRSIGSGRASAGLHRVEGEEGADEQENAQQTGEASRHNDVAHLERRLQTAAPGGVRLAVIDSVYSMDGDIVPLPEIRKVCDAHDALLMVDEAHALGVIGATGGGIEEHFGNTVRVVRLGAPSKAIPSMGGWVAGSLELIDHLKYAARPSIFSAALAPLRRPRPWRRCASCDACRWCAGTCR